MAHEGLHSAIIKRQAELPKSTEADRRIFKDRGWGRLHRRGGFGRLGFYSLRKSRMSAGQPEAQGVASM